MSLQEKLAVFKERYAAEVDKHGYRKNVNPAWERIRFEREPELCLEIDRQKVFKDTFLKECSKADMIKAQTLLMKGDWQTTPDSSRSHLFGSGEVVVFRLQESYTVPDSVMESVRKRKSPLEKDSEQAHAHSSITEGVLQALNQICAAEMFAQGKFKMPPLWEMPVGISGEVDFDKGTAHTSISIRGNGPDFLASLQRAMAGAGRGVAESSK